MSDAHLRLHPDLGTTESERLGGLVGGYVGCVLVMAALPVGVALVPAVAAMWTGAYMGFQGGSASQERRNVENVSDVVRHGVRGAVYGAMNASQLSSIVGLL